jgi:hypothetical protein
MLGFECVGVKNLMLLLRTLKVAGRVVKMIKCRSPCGGLHIKTALLLFLAEENF